MHARDKLIIALDVADLKRAKDLVRDTMDSCQTYKVGLEFFFRFGLSGILAIKDLGVDIFLDLKVHDIPNTVHASLLQVLPLRPKFLTIHASGGEEMLGAAKRALLTCQGHNPVTKLLAVTVLTHLSRKSLTRMKIPGDANEIAASWLKPIKSDPCFGAVCSPHEAPYLRSFAGPELTLVCPGIRPLFSTKNDQTRIATPAKAIYDGANYLVVGRPITRAEDPKLAARSVIHEIETAFKEH